MDDYYLGVDEHEREMLIMALAHLAVDYPGWDSVLHQIANRLENTTDEPSELFEKLRDLHRRNRQQAALHNI